MAPRETGPGSVADTQGRHLEQTEKESCDEASAYPLVTTGGDALSGRRAKSLIPTVCPQKIRSRAAGDQAPSVSSRS